MRIIIHDGNFHADELFACALLWEAFHSDIPITRTRQITTEEMNDPDVWVLDVGGEYSPLKHNFDHHHNEDLSSTNVLVLNYLFEKEIIEKELYSELKGSFNEISAIDKRGLDTYNGFQVNSFISALNKLPADAFDTAMEVARAYIMSQRESSKDVKRSRGIWDTGVPFDFDIEDQKKPGFIFCIAFPVHWKRYGDYPMLVCPHQTQPGKYQVLSISGDKYPIQPGQNEVFIHNNRFIAVYTSKEDALSAARTSMFKYYEQQKAKKTNQT